MKTACAVEPTRERVARLLLAEGPATAAALSARLGLSPAAVRRHLDAMVADGTLVVTHPPGRRARMRGRPARSYALSGRGHARAPHAYDELALDALRQLDAVGAVDAFARDRAAQLARRYAEVRDVTELAARFTADGYGATVHPMGSGVQLCQHHCPVSRASREFPQLCDAETAAISLLLGTHVQRLATIAHGDGVCTTYLPGVPPGPPAGELPGRSAPPGRTPR